MDTRIDLAKSAGSSPPRSHRLHPPECHSREVSGNWIILSCSLEPDNPTYLFRCRGQYPNGNRCISGVWSANATLCERHFYQDNDETDVAAANAGKMQEGDDRHARMLAADAARMKASGNAERLEILTQNLMSQGLTHAQAQEQLAKAGYDGSSPVTKPQVGTAIREAFEKGL